VIPADQIPVLDRDQLRDVTLEDEDMMREIVSALIEDASQQIHSMETAIRERDGRLTARLAHYSRGACANLGAKAVAATLEKIERQGAAGQFGACGASLAALGREIERLRVEAETL
jgi:HPt (histidine-containing phosphotransfer) domain-containing protein